MARIMQVNMAGLSTHCTTALSFHLNQGKPHAVLLTETHRELSAHEIFKYSDIIFCGTTGQGGLLFYSEKDITHVLKNLNAPIDSVWAIVTISKIPISLKLSAFHQPAHQNYKLLSVSSRKR